MKVLVEQTLAEEFATRNTDCDVQTFDNRNIEREEFIEKMQGVEALGFRWPMRFEIDEAMLGYFPDLKHVHKSGSGLEHSQVLDLAALKRLGIMFSNNAGLNADVVAEYALMLTVLSLRPAVVHYINRGRDGIWSEERPAEIPAPLTLANKTVGVIGLGAIGTAIAQRLKAMNVGCILGYQRNPRFEHTAFIGLEWTGLDDLLRRSQVIIVALPINATTTGLISRERIALMRTDATVINIGRGGVFDEQALYESLRDRKIRAAGLDVLTEEPSSSPLMHLPNVIVTPHTAGTAVEMQQLQVAGAIDALVDFAAGREPRRLWDRSVLAAPSLRAIWLRTAQANL